MKCNEKFSDAVPLATLWLLDSHSVASGYHSGRCRERPFSSLQKAPSGNAVLSAGAPCHQRLQRTGNTFIAPPHTQPALWGYSVSSALPACPPPQLSLPGLQGGVTKCPLYIQEDGQASLIPRQGPWTSSFLHDSLWDRGGNVPSLPSTRGPKARAAGFLFRPPE